MLPGLVEVTILYPSSKRLPSLWEKSFSNNNSLAYFLKPSFFESSLCLIISRSVLTCKLSARICSSRDFPDLDGPIMNNFANIFSENFGRLGTQLSILFKLAIFSLELTVISFLLISNCNLLALQNTLNDSSINPWCLSKFPRAKRYFI